MPVIQLREFTSDVPFFLVRFTGKEYPLTVNRTGPTVPKSLLLRSPRYYRDIEEKEKGKQDTDEATAIIKAELSYKNGSQWIPLPTDGPIRMRYDAGYVLCMSYVMNAQLPAEREIGKMMKQSTELNTLLWGTTHLFYNGKGPADWWLNTLAVSADKFAHVLEKEVSRYLKKTVTVFHGPCHYYDTDDPPIHREYVSGGRLREESILYYFDKEKSYSSEREYRFVVMIDGEQQNTRSQLEVPFSSELRACFAYSIAFQMRQEN